MRKQILKKKFLRKKIELLFSDSLQAVGYLNVHIFSTELLEHRQNDKNFLVGENFFLEKKFLFKSAWSWPHFFPLLFQIACCEPFWCWLFSDWVLGTSAKWEEIFKKKKLPKNFSEPFCDFFQVAHFWHVSCE